VGFHVIFWWYSFSNEQTTPDGMIIVNGNLFLGLQEFRMDKELQEIAEIN